jgi:chromosome segregation ATPase
MFTTKLGIVSVIAIAGIAILAMIQHQFQVRLREENESLRQQLAPLPRLAADNQRLSNLVEQAKVAQASVNEQYQELLRLRREVSRLTQEKEDSNRVNQAKMTQSVTDQLHELSGLRSDVSVLSQGISKLREEIRQLHAVATTSPAPEEEKPIAQARSAEDPSMSIRIIDTHTDTFAEKLKRSVAAQDGETFEEVFGRFLQANGIETRTIVGLAFDQRNGRVIVRAPAAALDQIEKLTLALDRSP